MSEWQPIETAPTNGDYVLVWYPIDGQIGMASYYAGVWLDWDGDLYEPPTHWMPLPEPPK